MSKVDEKKLLEIEKLRQDIQLNMKKFDIELSKKHYEAWRVALYSIAVGAWDFCYCEDFTAFRHLKNNAKI